MRRLNVGCGRNIIKDWINIDSVVLPGVDFYIDLEKCGEASMPLEDDSVDEFLLNHSMEHVRNVLPMMQELYRVAKDGARCVINVPYGSSDDAWEDPTHVRPYFPGSFGYFSQPYYWRADYGYKGDWRVDSIVLKVSKVDHLGSTPEQIMQQVMVFRNLVQEMTVNLIAVKPMREAKRELQTTPILSFHLC